MCSSEQSCMGHLPVLLLIFPSFYHHEGLTHVRLSAWPWSLKKAWEGIPTFTRSPSNDRDGTLQPGKRCLMKPHRLFTWCLEIWISEYWEMNWYSIVNKKANRELRYWSQGAIVGYTGHIRDSRETQPTVSRKGVTQSARASHKRPPLSHILKDGLISQPPRALILRGHSGLIQRLKQKSRHLWEELTESPKQSRGLLEDVTKQG